MAKSKEIDLDAILKQFHPVPADVKDHGQIELHPFEWKDIRLFISSSFVDTHGERDLLVKKIIPSINTRFKESFIKITPIDLRWGVLAEDAKNCEAIQKTCLAQVDNSRHSSSEAPWFLGLRTDRYGWVQDELRDKSKYSPNHHLYEWVDTLKSNDKSVSITSLECIHASIPVSIRRPAKTIFFFKRHFENSEDIERNMKWIFDYEYVVESESLDESIRNQYTPTEKTLQYKGDQDSLDEYLKSSDYTEYLDYSCRYEKGGAVITGEDKTRNKKFGIGRVSSLEEFELKVTNCLINAIMKNFKPADTSHIPKHVLANLPHESMIKIKAKDFVGRSELCNKISSHCTNTQLNNNVMVVKGLPGCGKSSLMAKVAATLVNDQRNGDNMVFVHAVGSCPQSNDLEEMLIRLHSNIDFFVKNDEDKAISASDLRGKHVDRMIETAKEHPNKMFIIVVDAVNQFHETMQAWKMWWVPGDAPNNLRIVISTLPDENNTFDNAVKRCPAAEVVEVGAMTDEEGRQMVSAILARFNKSLCTDKTDRLGDQMSLLLEKNLSPLYLSAATNVLRTEGVYEKMTEFIKYLPSTVQELFRFLLNSWSKDYGERFVRFLVCIITLSRDGLPENMLTDFLAFIDERSSEKFDCSFSVIFESMRSFLAAEGGGHIRFYHDQLNKVVRDRYLKENPLFEKELHDWFSKFYYDVIKGHLKENTKPSGAATYYEDCLQQQVYHEVESWKLENGNVDRTFTKTLRNILFIRERIIHNQLNSLNQDYLQAIAVCGDDEKHILQKWRKFVSVYSPYISESPNLALHMALNQVETSSIYKDSKELKGVDCVDKVFAGHLMWLNKPNKEVDHVVTKYSSEKFDVCACTTQEDDLVALGTWLSEEVHIHQMSTGTLVHKVKMKREINSLCFSTQQTQQKVWVGERYGHVSVVDADIGKVVWRSADEEVQGDVLFVHAAGEEYVVCGTDGGIVAVYDQSTYARRGKWETGLICWCRYTYQANNRCVVVAGGDHCSASGRRLVKCFTLEGEALHEIVDVGNGEMCAHPLNNNIVLCVVEYKNDEGKEKRKLVEVDMSTSTSTTIVDDVSDIIKEYSDYCNPTYSRVGDKVICLGGDGKTVHMYNNSAHGAHLNTITAHGKDVMNITLVPNSNLIVTAARDGSYLINLPTTSGEGEEEVGENSSPIISLCLINNNTEYVSLQEDGRVTKWYASTQRATGVRVRLEGMHEDSEVLTHPHDNYFFLTTRTHLHFVNNDDLSTIAQHKVVNEDEDENECITDLSVLADGIRCVLVKKIAHTVFTLDIRNLDNITIVQQMTMHDLMTFSCDIHPVNNDIIVCSGFYVGVGLLQLSTSTLLKKLRSKCTDKVMFNSNATQLVYADSWPDYITRIITLDGDLLHELPHKTNSPSLTWIRERTQLVMGTDDRRVRIYNDKWEQVATFNHHSAEVFNCFLHIPEHDLLLAGNKNGKMYNLKYCTTDD